MRIKRAVPAGRPRLTAIAGLLLISAVTAAGCSASNSSSAASRSAPASPPSAAADGGSGFAAPAAEPAAGGSSSSGSAGSGSTGSGSTGSGSTGSGSTAKAPATGKFAASGQQLIYTAQLTVRAASVNGAVTRATSIVTAAGGYVSGEDATAGQGKPSQARATLTFKIPVAAYRTTLASLSAGGLGTQLSLAQQAQDVTQQVADTNSRVASDQAAIAQLRALLKQAGSVSSLLEVQNQIDAQESDLEAMLAQQGALNKETSYATLTLTLVGPKAVVSPAKTAPPPGLAGGLSRGWHAFGLTVSWLLTAFGAAAPFIAAVLILGGLGWAARRQVARRRQRPATGG